VVRLADFSQQCNQHAKFYSCSHFRHAKPFFALAHKVKRGANIIAGTPYTSSASVGSDIGFRASVCFACGLYFVRARWVKAKNEGIDRKCFVCKAAQFCATQRESEMSFMRRSSP
jgi:hypothetical protein